MKKAALAGLVLSVLTAMTGRAEDTPPQTEHNILNTGTEPLVYIFCVAPVA